MPIEKRLQSLRNPTDVEFVRDMLGENSPVKILFKDMQERYSPGDSWVGSRRLNRLPVVFPTAVQAGIKYLVCHFGRRTAGFQGLFGFARVGEHESLVIWRQVQTRNYVERQALCEVCGQAAFRRTRGAGGISQESTHCRSERSRSG